jgi:hypothetical protein
MYKWTPKKKLAQVNGNKNVLENDILVTLSSHVDLTI